MTDFLKPKNEPNQTFGMDTKQYIKRRISTVGKGTVADDYSSQLAKFMIISIVNIILGKAIEVKIAQMSQSVP